MFAEPEQNVEQFRLRDDAVVADFGTGAGWYAIAAAKACPRGKVYAIDVQQDMLEKLKAEALRLHLFNIETIWGDIERVGGTKLANNSVDAVIIANVLFQVPDRQAVAAEIDRILKPRGRLLVIDWSEALPGAVPAIPKTTMQDLFYARGFGVEGDITTGPHHYGMIFRKP
jgi:ubiquinone/menaquinone biosynthesis C-methylase UbiE